MKTLLPFCLSLMMPFFALSQHYWLKPEPEMVTKKSPFRLTILYGDSLKAETGGDIPRMLNFSLHQAKDSFSLAESSAGTSAYVKPELVKEPSLAAVVLQLPEKLLEVKQISGQFTKEQKALMTQQDTSVLKNEIPASRINYAKALVPITGQTDKDGLYNRQLNHDLEILFNSDPALAKPGGQVVVQVLLHQRVLPYHKFTVWRMEKTGKVTVSEATTNKAGLKILTLPKAGQYVLVVSQEGPNRLGTTDQVEWESHEASFWFTVQ